MWLSPEAQKAKREAAGRRRFLRAEAKRKLARMERGPRLEGPWLVIPSDWYSKDAVAFWKALGARYHTGDPEHSIWILDTRRARWQGKRYGRWAWLRSARRKFYELYPEARNARTDQN